MSADLEAVMKEFMRGFGRADRDALANTVTDDFEWHMHWTEAEGDQPTGKVLRGIDEVMAEIERRQASWTDLSYDNMELRYLDDMVVQTFTVSGVDEHGTRFNSDAVDLYPVRDGKLSRKQTYWKQPGTNT